MMYPLQLTFSRGAWLGAAAGGLVLPGLLLWLVWGLWAREWEEMMRAGASL